MRRLILLLLLLVAATLGWRLTQRGEELSLAALAPRGREAKPLPGVEIFNQPTLLAFQIELAPDALERLRRAPRSYVPATVTIDGVRWADVGVHLKGEAGSYRNVNDRPALTLSFSKFAEKRRWAGLRKIHLNNSVQDGTFMSEYLGSELFRAANVPTPRVAWATVQLNQRKLGLYVLKEGFTEDFLKCCFQRADGNLYDGGFVKDLNEPLLLDCGRGVTNRSDLKTLVAVARERDPARRWERLQETVEVERFATMAAISVMVGDWDGYPLKHNNYRVYFNPANGRAVFLPHGMDQLFGVSDMPVLPDFGGMVARGFVETPPGRQLYEARFQGLFANVFRLERMTNSIRRIADLLRPVQPDIDRRAADLTGRIQARMAYLARQPLLKQAPPPLPVRATAPAPVTDSIGTTNATAARAKSAGLEPIPPDHWQPQPTGNSRLEQAEVEGRRMLQIAAKGHSLASWRATVRLQPGRYRFEGRARGTGIEALNDEKGEGAGLRVTGSAEPRKNKLTGDTRWVSLAHEFEITGAEQDVVCVCELRALKGRVQFEMNSLRVVPLAR